MIIEEEVIIPHLAETLFAATAVSSLAAGGCGAGAAGQEPPASAGNADLAEAAAASQAPLAGLAWMVGRWTQGGDEVASEEHWTAPHPRLMLGTSRTFRDGQLVATEHMQIEPRPAGIVYTAWPEGQARTEFRLIESATERAVFANPHHDFPKRILYWREADRLRARVEGDADGAIEPLSFDWGKQAASTPPPLRKSAVISAPAAAIWEAFTTENGARTFFAPDARIEPQRGGPYELYFMLDGPVGMRGSEDCTVVDLVAPTRLDFTWNFPPSISTLRHGHTLVTVLLTPHPNGTTGVEITATGWRDGEDWTLGHAYFDRAWGIVLDRLQRRFEKGPIDWSQDP